MELNFRKVTTDDIDQFNMLMDDLSCRAKDQNKLREKIEATKSNNDLYLLVAEEIDTGKLVGSLLAVIFDDYCDDCRPLMVIENVVTSKSCRGMGIGRKMFEAIESWGRSRDVNYAILCSAMHRLEAHKFYDALGYKEVKGYKKYL